MGEALRDIAGRNSPEGARRRRACGKSVSTQRIERLTKALFDGQRDLSDLAAQEGMTLTRLAAWAHEPMTIESLEGLCRLSDVRAQLLVSRYRTLAAARLFELAKNEEAHETARKACVDLLKVSLVSMTERTEGAEGGEAMGIASPMSEAQAGSLRALLAQIGGDVTAGPEGGGADGTGT